MTIPPIPPLISASDVLKRYDAVLLDVWGVLTDATQALPYAAEFVRRLDELKKPYFIVTNGSTFNPEAAARNFAKKGIDVSAERVINSGILVTQWLRENLSGLKKRFIVLGPEEASYIVEEAGHERVAMESDADGVVIANQSGYDLLSGIDRILSLAIAKIEQGEEFHLLLGNPDLIYVGGPGKYGITCGMIALAIEEALSLRFGKKAPKFIKLGKPYAAIFMEAKSRVQAGQSIVMIGDQMETDVKGALEAGIDAVLVGTGVCRIDDPATFADQRPHYVMRDLRL